jgi:hypothetical protein
MYAPAPLDGGDATHGLLLQGRHVVSRAGSTGPDIWQGAIGLICLLCLSHVSVARCAALVVIDVSRC